MVLRYANILRNNKQELINLCIMDKNKSNGVLTRPFLDGHLPVGTLRIVGKRVTGGSVCCSTSQVRVVVEQGQGGYVTPALGRSSGSSGAHSSKSLLKTWESVQERSTRGIKGLEKVLCSQTLFQGHNLLTSQIESEGAISLQWLSIFLGRINIFNGNHKNRFNTRRWSGQSQTKTKEQLLAYYCFFKGDNDFF